MGEPPYLSMRPWVFLPATSAWIVPDVLRSSVIFFPHLSPPRRVGSRHKWQAPPSSKGRYGVSGGTFCLVLACLELPVLPSLFIPGFGSFFLQAGGRRGFGLTPFLLNHLPTPTKPPTEIVFRPVLLSPPPGPFDPIAPIDRLQPPPPDHLSRRFSCLEVLSHFFPLTPGSSVHYDRPEGCPPPTPKWWSAR